MLCTSRDMAYNKINETLRYDKQLRLNVEGKSLPWAGMAMNFTITVRQCRTADPSCANSRSLKAQALANTLKPYADMTLSKNWVRPCSTLLQKPGRIQGGLNSVTPPA